MDDKLKALIDKARERVVSEEERASQRIGFAYGNAPKDDKNTVETIRDASHYEKSLSTSEHKK